MTRTLARPSPGGRPLRVLVAEDNPDTADSVAQLLDLYGFEVRTARDGHAALAEASVARPDVVVVDLGLDGWELARRVGDLAAPKRPLLIALGDYGREKDQRRSEAASIDLYLTKPADAEKLLAVLRRFQALLASCEPLTRAAG